MGSALFIDNHKVESEAFVGHVVMVVEFSAGGLLSWRVGWDSAHCNREGKSQEYENSYGISRCVEGISSVGNVLPMAKVIEQAGRSG